MTSVHEGLTGPYDVITMPMGRGSFPGSMLFWASNFDHRAELCFQAVLIRGQGRVILVNTGHDEDLTALNQVYSEHLSGTQIVRPQAEWIHTALAGLGVDAADVTDLVLTPLGTYSSARLQDFPNARIWLGKTGWVTFHTWRSHPHDGRETTVTPEQIAYLTGPAWQRVTLIDGEAEIAPGVRAWETGGHHRATLCVEVDTDDATVAVSDIYFHVENFERHHPIGMSENIYEVLAAYDRIRAAGMIPLPMMDPQNTTRYPGGRVCTARD